MANVWLFVPLGVVLVRAGWPARTAVAYGTLLSVTIEALQALGIPGRTTALSDVAANALGTALGAVLAVHLDALRRPRPATAWRLAGATALAWCGLMTGSAWLLARDPSSGPRPPRARALATVPNLGWFHGRVTRFVVDGWATGRGDTGPVIVAAPLGRRAAVQVTLSGGDDRPGFVPAAAVVDDARRPVLLVGQRRRAAEVRVRTRAQRWRLREPALVAPDALAKLREGHPAAHAAVTVALDADRLTLAVRAEGDGANPTVTSSAAALRPGPALGWALVVPGARPWGAEAPVLGALWVGALLIPAGFWAGTAARGRPRAAVAVGAAASAVVPFGLLVLPALARGPRAAAGDCLTAAGAVLVGWWCAPRAQLPRR